MNSTNQNTAEMPSDTARLDGIALRLDGYKWSDTLPMFRPRYSPGGEYSEKYICASTFRAAIDAALALSVSELTESASASS